MEKFKDCYDIFLSKAFDTDECANSCKIHDAFGGLDGQHHNCLGCNFSDSSELILKYLEKHEELNDIQRNFTVYILLLYLLVERIDIVLDIIQLPEIYREKHFKIFQRIRKWANFIKHPKAFILTHHPFYDFENSGIVHTQNFSLKIDDNFVTTYYKGQKDPIIQKKTNKELYEKLKNKSNILVVFPDITNLTENLCYSYNKFIDIIINNEVYIEILNDDTTISDYFENAE